MSLTAIGLLAVLLASPAAVTLDDDDIACTRCERTMEADWNYCPWDGVPLRLECPKCKRVSSPKYEFCPYDATPLGKGDGGKDGATAEPEDAPVTNTPGSVRDDFLKALQTQDKQLLDSLVAWERFHESYVERKGIEPESLELDDFRKKRRAELLSDEVKEKVSKMVVSQDLSSGLSVVGKVAKLPLVLVNPKDSKDKLSQNLRIEEIDNRWQITDIQ